jgi:hypothetical protein
MILWTRVAFGPYRPTRHSGVVWQYPPRDRRILSMRRLHISFHYPREGGFELTV